MTTTEWKLIRVSKDMHKQLSQLGQYGDSMGDILRSLLDSYYDNNGGGKGKVKGKDEDGSIKTREELKSEYSKFKRHTSITARLARRNINYSSKPSDPERGPKRVEGD